MSGFDNTSYTTRVVAATTTANANDSAIFVEVPTANVTVTLPAAAGLAGREYTVSKDATATYTVTIAATSGSVLGGTNPMVAGAVHSSTWCSDGTNWYCIAYV